MPRMPHPRAALSGYCDDRLPPWRRAVLEHHLRGCTRCALVVAQTRALGELLRTPPPVPEAPTALVERLLALDPAALDPAVLDPGALGPPALAPPVPSVDPHARRAVGAAAVLAAGLLVLGTVAAGATVTAASMPWPSASTRASMSAVVPRLFSGGVEPGGAVSVRPVDNDQRP